MSPLLTDEAILAKLARDSPIAIVVSALVDGKILDVNDSFLHVFGYTRDELIGQTSVKLGMWAEPSQRAALAAVLMAGQPLRDFATTVRTKTGAERQVLATVSEVAIDGATCLVTQLVDITAYRRTETRFRALVEQLPVTTYAHGLDGVQTLVYISPQVETMLGYSPVEVLAGRPDFLTSRVHPEDQEALREAVERAVATGDPLRVEYRVQARDGRWVWLRDEAVLVRDEQERPLVWQGVMADFTERKQAEAARQEAEARYSALFQHSVDAVLLTAPDGRILDANPEACRMFGRTIDELRQVGRAGVVDPDDPRLAAALAERARTGHFRGELTMRRRDGEPFPAEAATQVFTTPDGQSCTSMTIRDLTAQRQAEAALRESEERFRSAFAHAPIGMSLVTHDGRFMQVNRALCELVGYPEEELLGKTIEAITHPDDLADGLEQAARLWAGEIDTYQLEKRYLRKDGHVVWIHLTGSIVRDASGPKYSIAQIVDITGRRHVEMDLAIMHASEREYTRQLRALTEMRADLTAMIAHELRAPVAALRMMTFLLATGELSSQAEGEMFAAVKSEIEQLDRLINDVADVTTAEREDFSVQPTPVPLNAIFESAAVFARATLGGHPFTVLPAPDVSVWCDAERISQVLRNLLGNTATHTPSGTPVELRAHRDGARVCIEVADRGPGLPAEDVALIFEKFGRGRQAVARQTLGAGLGLYLSRQIVQAHGSDLTVESAPGKGTVFAFALEMVP